MHSFFAQKGKFENLAIPLLSVAFGVVLTLVVLVPQISGAIKDYQEIRELEGKLKLMAEKAAVLTTLDTAELSVRTLKLTQAVPNDEDLGYFLAGVKSMARRANVAFVGIELLDTGALAAKPEAEGKAKIARRRVPSKPTETVVRIAVLLKGDIAALRQFLLEVEESIPLSVVEEFTFSRQKDASEFMGNLTLKYWYLPLPETLGKAEQPLEVLTQAEEQVYEQISDLREPEEVELPRVPTGNVDLML